MTGTLAPATIVGLDPALRRSRAATAASTATSPPAVILGLDSPTGLQTARIFAGYGIPVIGIARDPRHPCCRTRRCGRLVAADTTGPGLIAALESLAGTLSGPAVLVPCTDLAVLLVSRHRAALADAFRFALPEPEMVETLVDKGAFYRLARREGLPVPRTVVLADAPAAEEAGRTLRFPVVLKPVLKTPEWRRRSLPKAFRLARPEELLRLYDRLAAWSGPLIVQEWIAGDDADHYTCNAYFGRDGDPLVTFTSRKLRQWPPFGGEACLSIECRNEVVAGETVRLFGRAGFHGLGYLEMKRDARTGEHLIIEPNVGRPTGRSAAAEAAGVELLRTLYCDVLDRPLPEARHQSYRGVRWIHSRRDLQSAFHQWRRGRLTLTAWRRSIRGPRTDALFSWRDPVPFCADLARVAGDRFRGRKKGGVADAG